MQNCFMKEKILHLDMFALSITFSYCLLLYLDMFAVKNKRHLKGLETWGLKTMIFFLSS